MMRVYDQSKADAERAANLNELYNSTKVKKKLESDKKRAESAERRYRRAVKKTQGLETKLFDTDMPRIMSEFEDMERTRVATMRSSLEAFSHSYLDLMPLIEAVCHSIDTHIQGIDSNADINQFILDKRTGKDKETHRTEFEEYSSQYKSCVKPGSTPNQSPHGSANNSPAPQRHNPGMQESVSMSSVQSLQNAQRSSQPNMGGTGNIQLEKGGQANIRHSMNYGSQSISSGNFDQLRGSAPVQEAAMQPTQVPQQLQQPVQPANPPKSRGIGYCRGLHDYPAQQPSELSFKYVMMH